jgi:hypothetical protein
MRCVFIAVGLPNLISFAAVILLAPLLSRFLRAEKRGMLLMCVDVLSGIFSVFAGIWLTESLGFRPNMCLPMISAIWFAIHFAQRNKFVEFYLASLGVFAGWAMYQTVA